MEGFGGESSRGCRTRTVKRSKTEEKNTELIKLERVLGVTVTTNAALDCNPTGKTVAYPAGCTVVLLNTQTEEQNHIINTCKKSISSLAFSSCGRYLVTGECGHQPAVRVWDLQSDPRPGHPGLFPQYQQIAKILSHTSGISCVAFSPNGKYVVSVGTQHDMLVNVWDWRNNAKIAGNKVSNKVKALAFSEDGRFFVTVGNRHVKFWYFEYGKAKYKEAVPLMGRSAILGEQSNNYFCDVACGKANCGDSTFAITRSGLLCEFNIRRLLDKWVELRTTKANCIAVGEHFIFVGCADGIVRCFDPLTLRYVTTLPRTHYLGVDVSQGLNISHMFSAPPDAKYPDTIAITYDEVGNKLTCIYNDHSLYVWDVHNINRVGKSQSFVYHSACIWGVEMAPPQSPLPPGSFLTCSSDDTIRVWNMNKLNDNNSRGIYTRNIYSNELLKIIYVNEDLTFLKDTDVTLGCGSNEKLDSLYDVRNGVRCIRLSPDGQHLASGDRAGNIRIHDTNTMNSVLKIEAHDAEVLCLEYSGTDSRKPMMASASRDRLIHVFDVKEDYNLLQTLDDHSSSITAVKLVSPAHGNLQMVTCGADKCLLFRSLNATPDGGLQFVREHLATGKTTLYDMEVDYLQKHVLTACQDRNVRVYNVNSGKHTKTFKGSTGDDGTLIKVVMDRSGLYLATSCTDKSLSVYDYYTGECMVTMCGHSELATGLRFTNDCRHLISASGDGCIFVWRVPHDMVVTMHARLGQHATRMGKPLDLDLPPMEYYDPISGIDNNLKYGLSKLPRWARKFMSSDGPTSGDGGLPTPTKEVAAPKGRWAERADKNAVLSIYTGSPQSSDSGTDFNQYSERRGLTNRQDGDEFNEINKLKVSSASGSGVRRTHLTDDSGLGSLRDADNESTAHDGDIDSDHEYRHQQLYYPPTVVDLTSGNEFTVTNIDTEELRRSVRKSKRKNLPPITIPKITSQESEDDDDDDASTPSGENTDRNSMSLLSVSSESLDQLAYREKYLQSTFESLSSAEIDAPGGSSSISSQYHTRTSSSEKLRNVAVINAAKQTKYNPEMVKTREELNRMIADTRKKLANVGYNNPLKYSKSIHDLSHIPEKDKSAPIRKQVQLNSDSQDGNLRRSCSLSDLRIQSPSPVQPQRKPEQVSDKFKKKNNVLERSRSTGVLNQSDSDTETVDKKAQSRLMRPTISSLNKTTTIKRIQSRKRMTHSLMNLSNVGQEDSSSEDGDKIQPKVMMPPPRSRNLNSELKASNNLQMYKKGVTDMNKTLTNDSITTIKLSTQRCQEVALELIEAANRVLELDKRLTQPETNDDKQIPSFQRTNMLKILENSVTQTQKMLQSRLALERLRQNDGSLDINQTDAVKKLNDMMSKGLMNDQNTFVSMMQHYSDILLGMMQQKIHNSDT